MKTKKSRDALPLSLTRWDGYATVMLFLVNSFLAGLLFWMLLSKTGDSKSTAQWTVNIVSVMILSCWYIYTIISSYIAIKRKEGGAYIIQTVAALSLYVGVICLGSGGSMLMLFASRN